MKLINACHVTGKLSDCLNRLLLEVLGCAPAIILMIFFSKEKNLPTVGKITPQNYSTFYNRIKVCTVKTDLRVSMLQIQTINLTA
jgi:hypothetical protein